MPIKLVCTVDIWVKKKKLGFDNLRDNLLITASDALKCESESEREIETTDNLAHKIYQASRKLRLALRE